MYFFWESIFFFILISCRGWSVSQFNPGWLRFFYSTLVFKNWFFFILSFDIRLLDINLYKKKFYKLSQSYIPSRVLIKLTWVDLNLVFWAKTINIAGCWKNNISTGWSPTRKKSRLQENNIRRKGRFHRDLNSGYWIQSPMSLPLDHGTTFEPHGFKILNITLYLFSVVLRA